MTAQCPIHNTEMQSKEGPYGVYYSHTVDGEGYCNGKKITPFKGPQAPARPAMPVNKVEKRELGMSVWSDEEKSRQIARLSLAKTFIQSGVDYDNAVLNGDLEKWEKYVFNEED